jgi:hypothetical protein
MMKKVEFTGPPEKKNRLNLAIFLITNFDDSIVLIKVKRDEATGAKMAPQILKKGVLASKRWWRCLVTDPNTLLSRTPAQIEVPCFTWRPDRKRDKKGSTINLLNLGIGQLISMNSFDLFL